MTAEGPLVFSLRIGPTSGGYEWALSHRREVFRGFHQDRAAALAAAFETMSARFDEKFPIEEFPKVGPMGIEIG